MRRVEVVAPAPPASGPDARFLDRMSRVIGTFGLDTVVRVTSMRVFLVGCGGVGAEAAKNLSLAGIHTLTLFDNTIATPVDQGANFAITDAALKAHRGATRAELTAPLMGELNPSMSVRVAQTLDEATLAGHHVLLWTLPATLDELVRWDRYCRSQRLFEDTDHPASMAFIAAQTHGVVGSIFVDFGESFVVNDADGRPALQKMLLEATELVDKKNRPYTRLRYATPEGMAPGCFPDRVTVKLADVQGFAGGPAPIESRALSGIVSPFDAPSTMRLYPSLRSLGYGPYQGGGFVVEVKTPIAMTFEQLSASIVTPRMEAVCPAEEGTIHLLQHALLLNGGVAPNSGDALIEAVQRVNKANAELDAFLASPPPREATEEDLLNEEPAALPPPTPPRPLHLSTIDDAFLRRIQPTLAYEFQPLSTFFGAILAQEVIKTTGKYTPIHQWVHYQCAEVLPATPPPPPHETGTRYDALVALFGDSFLDRLRRLNVFLVGCGALGCEDLKNLALLGIATRGGLITITDNDRIEVSNLSRQFLFREDNVGQPKSVAAAARAKTMNPDVAIRSLQEFVGLASEHIFNDEFWGGLDVVVNALDNIPSRLYVDAQCVTHRKVLIEGGTMGTGGNVDVIVPGQTTSYADGGGADETGGIPMCTLRNFPYTFDHCIEWARALFEDTFVAPVAQLQQLLEAPDAFDARMRQDVQSAANDGDKRSKLERHIKALRQLMQTLRAFTTVPTMEECVGAAWALLFELYRDRVMDLIVCFPKDAKKKNGEPFWSGHRRFPTALVVSAESRNAVPDIDEFLIAASNVFAEMLGVHERKHDPKGNDPAKRWKAEYRTTDWARRATATLEPPAYRRRAVDDLDNESSSAAAADQTTSTADLEVTLDGLLREAHTLREGIRAVPPRIEFEKDDDDNFHIDFIAAAANLRALTYSIATQDRMKVKLTAGRIIPAIATTTAAVTGLAMMELLKALQNKPNSDLRNVMFDLGSNNYTLFDRDPPLKHRSTIQKRYIPEQDYTYRTRIVCVPNPFTKYDRIDIPVASTTTVKQVADALVEKLTPYLPSNASGPLEVEAMGYGKGTIWNGLPKHPNTDAPILPLIERRAMEALGAPGASQFWHGRRVVTGLQVNFSITLEDDDCDELDVQTPAIHLILS